MAKNKKPYKNTANQDVAINAILALVGIVFLALIIIALAGMF